MHHASSRAAFAALALSAGLGLSAAACTKADDGPTSPATNVSPDSSATAGSDANTVPPGASGQGARGGQGQGEGSP